MNNPNKRNLAYENFRLFYKDSAQSGEALISASSIKLKATRSLITERITLLRNSLLVPSEFAWALNYISINLEIFSSLLASHTKVLDLNKKDSLITLCCSYIKSMKGALLKGLVTMPDAKEKIHKLENEAVKNKVKIVCLEDHWILRMPKGPSSFILKPLLTSLNTEVVTKKQKPELKSIETTKHNFKLSVDFGSGFSKHILHNEKYHIVKQGDFSSGIDYLVFLADITKEINNTKDISRGAAGVGRDNPILKNLVNCQTSEVNTLIQDSDKKPKANLRGLYGYIAKHAIKLLPRELQNGAEIFLTGGVAKHRTLQKIFEEKVLLLLNLNLKLSLNISLLLALLFTYKTL